MITYRRLLTAADIEPCVGLQAQTWQTDDLEDVVPVHQLLTAVKYGGVMIGAFDADAMVGFCYGFVGLSDGRPMLCSHMLAVLPSHRGHGIGVTLKLAQRRACLDQGLEMMHWTFDPLEAVNGRLNVGRLGGIARLYEPNLYGEMRDSLNAGMPSDRLVVEWHLSSARAAAAEQGRPLPAMVHFADAVPLNEPDTPYSHGALPMVPALALFLPKSWQQLKRERPDLALQWRLATRQALQTAFAAGYVVTGFDAGAYILTNDKGLLV